MVQGGFKSTNPLVAAVKARKDSTQQKREERELDEGIVIDSDDLSSDDDGEDVTMLDAAVGAATSSPLKESRSTTSKRAKVEEPEADTYVDPSEVRAIVAELFNVEREIFALVYNHRTGEKAAAVSADMFFIHSLLVPPSKYRPETKTGDGEISEARENTSYRDVLKRCEGLNQLGNILRGSVEDGNQKRRSFADFQAIRILLQDAVNGIIDSNLKPQGRQLIEGIKQKLEKKEGLFRMNMMGKRVNFAARTVISPDPNIETNEIGVPPVFAKKLTFPEPVTNHNFYDMKEAVLNGFAKWPGASAIENETGQAVGLRFKNFEERQALANQLLAPSNTGLNGSRNKKVHRHLNNGDMVLMNRQPTLHKPSMMAHRVRVLPGERTLRMHYANCNTYNADFDGDEMNMHFPQNEIARSEALSIADTDHQYLVATSGKPLRGLIQDHISMGVWLTNKDTLFDQDDYYQLLCSCLRPESNQINSDRIKTVPPAIIKPKPLWTGKQVVTTVMTNITPLSHPGLTLQSKSQTPWERWDDEAEGQVIFDQGVLICGILDKAQLGPTGGGFIHAVYEAYGPSAAGGLLTILGRLLTKFLHMRAWSCGMDDLELTREGESKRHEKLQEAQTIGHDVALKYVTLDESDLPEQKKEKELIKRLGEVLKDNEKQAGLDNVYKARTDKLSSETTNMCLPAGLVKAFPKNQMQTMTTTGAKGSVVNANLISCNLGQQVLEGRRVPVMVSGKTLPSFKPFETKVRAGGYITDRFLTGVKPQEYYFHAMAGREGLIDTAVKTARSGYLQRCIIKAMEGLKSHYDATVRDSDGSMIQFLYGEDGLDVTKQKHLTDFRFLIENYLSMVANLELAQNLHRLKDSGAEEYNKSAIKRYRKTGKVDCIDPALALYNPGSNVGSTSESFAMALKAYCDENPQKKLRIKNDAGTRDASINKTTFNLLMNVKYMRSTIEPGEAVGVVAGQSIGEPSTQMTLNTFHLAGHAAKNVTLGIPRLREIVMTASKVISTPNMTLHLIPEVDEESAQRFAKMITKLTMAAVIKDVRVGEKIGKGRFGHARAKIYSIRLDLYPAAEYCEAYAISVDTVLTTLESKFTPNLARAIKKELTRRGEAKLLKESAALPEIGKASGKDPEPRGKADAELEGGEDDMDEEVDEDGSDEDAKRGRQRQNKTEAVSYEAPDEEEEDIAKKAQRETTPDVDDDVDSAIGGSPKTPQTEAGAEDGDSDDEEASAVKATAKEREARLKDKSPGLSRFEFDAKGAEWCEIEFEFDVSTAKLLLLPLVEAACHQAIIQAIPNLESGMYTTEKERDPVTKKMQEVPVVLTQGVNLKAMHAYQNVLNPHKIFTNDIWQMMTIYGIEAGRATIIREMDAVFKGHSITVDMRHLNLIADYMTRDGGFKPFSRMGLESSVSPLQKASFETTTGFVRDAVLEGDFDELSNPSARIVMGKLSGVGTGAFDILMPMEQQ